MGQLAVPIMIGAAVGGGTKLIQGKGLGGILKGAALGGALGGVGGTLGGATMQGASAAQGTSAVGAAQGAGQNMGVGLLDAGSDSLVFNPTSTLSSGAPGITTSALENALPTGINLPAGVGDALAANNIAGASYFDQFSQYAKDYATPKNLLGVAQVMSAMPENKAPLQNIGGGQVSHGQMPQYVPFNTGTTQTWKKRNQ